MMEPEDHPSYGPSYVLQLVASLGIWYGLGRWGGLSNETQQYEVILIWMFAFRPLSTLIHELGHAAAVRRLARRPAEVFVGKSSAAIRGRLGQLQISFSPVPVIGSQVAGICRYKSDGVGWRTRGWISLAGPGATLVELLVMLALLPLWSHASVVVRDLFTVGSAMLALNVVTNLLPTPLVRDAHGQVVLGRDGYNALEAFRNARKDEPAISVAFAAIASLPEVDTTPRRPAFRLGERLPQAEAVPGDDAAGSAPDDDAAGGAPGDVAQRALADIWSIQQPVVDQPPAEPPTRPSSDGQPAHGDSAQRALAEIWSHQPLEVGPGPAATDSAVRRSAADAVVAEMPESTDGKLELAVAHLQAGRAAEAIPLLEAALSALQADPAPGAAEASKLASARGALARAYLAARRPQLAVNLYELLLADPSPATDVGRRFGYRIARAQAFRAAGDAATATDQLEALVAELGSGPGTGTGSGRGSGSGSGSDSGSGSGSGDDPDRLIDAQVELATTYAVARRNRDAIKAYETALPLAERVLGGGHRKSLSIRLLLARTYQQDGQSQLATRVYRNLVSDGERALGPNDTLTRQAQGELTALLRNHPRR